MKPAAERGPRRIESRQNTRIKELRAGLARGARTPANNIAIEGLHLIEEAVKSGLKLHTVFVRSGNEGLLEHLVLGGRRSVDRGGGGLPERHHDRASAGHCSPGGGARVHHASDASAASPWW